MINDLRFALRQLRKTPGFTAVAIITLALGIGATTAIFSVVKSVLLSALPFPAADQLVVAWQSTSERSNFSFSYPNYLDYATSAKSFEALALSRRGATNLVGASGLPERAQLASVTANYFPVVGLKPILGRVFTAEEDRAGAEPVAVIGETLWQRRFNRDPGALGQSIQLNGRPHTIIGVLPAAMDLPAEVDAWSPLGYLTANKAFVDRGSYPSIYALGRLRPGVTLQQAQTEATAIWAQIKTANPADITSGITLQPLLENRVGQFRQGLYLLLGAVGLVLLIACANLSNLLLARGAQRSTYIAVRTALGASRGQIVRQLVIESLVLAGAGGGVGVAFAFAARQLIVALSPEGVSRFQNAGIDGPVLLFALGLAAACGVVFGLWPAWSASQVDLRTAMQSGGRAGSAGPARKRARESLIVAEVALTLLLLVGAGLLMKSFLRIQSTDLGFRPEKMLLAQLSLPGAKYPDEKRAPFTDALLARLEQLPGVATAAISSAPPLSPNWQIAYFVPDKQYAAGEMPLTDVATVSENFLRATGIRLQRGRDFSPGDIAGGPMVVIVDERMARQLAANGDVLGRRLRFSDGIADAEIIGVVPTVRTYGYAAEPPVPQLYFLQRQVPDMNSFTVLVRAKGDPLQLRTALAEIVASVDPSQPVFNLRSMEQDIARTQVTAKLYSYLLACFSALALVLAAVGLYGVISYSTAQRTREIGIRLALGALTGEVFTMILRQGFRLIAVGAALGVVAALALSRIAESLLYGVSTTDVSVYASVLAMLGLVALVACWLPARRAAKVDPMVALRAE